MQFDYFIGIDVSKATLDFAVVKANQILFYQQVSNDKKGIAEFLKRLRQQTKATISQYLFCLELWRSPIVGQVLGQSKLVPFRSEIVLSPLSTPFSYQATGV